MKVDFNRALAGIVGLTEGDAATSVEASLSGSRRERERPEEARC